MAANALSFEEPGLSTSAGPRDSGRAAVVGATFGLVTTRAEFDALEGPWNDLFARAGRDVHMFQSFNWLWHWCNHFLPESGDDGPTLSIVTAFRDGRLVMVWPLVTERTGPITQLGWMGEPVSQYGDVLVDDGTDAEALLRAGWDFIQREVRCDVVRLRRVRQDSTVAPLLAALDAQAVSEADAPYLPLGETPNYDAIAARQSGNARRNRKRQRRRLAERGPLEHQWHEAGKEAEALVSLAFTYKLDWLKARGLYSRAFSDASTISFFSDVARADSHPAGCYVYALSSDGHPAAVEIGLRCKGRTAIHIVTYDLAYEKSAAGALLLEDSVRRALDDGMTVFDFLPPGYDYKWEWSKAFVRVHDWALPLSASGRLYTTVYLRGLRNVLKRGVEALPLSLRRKLTEALSG